MKICLSLLMLGVCSMGSLCEAATSLIDSCVFGQKEILNNATNVGSSTSASITAMENGEYRINGTDFSTIGQNMTMTFVVDFSQITNPDSYTQLIRPQWWTTDTGSTSSIGMDTNGNLSGTWNGPNQWVSNNNFSVSTDNLGEVVLTLVTGSNNGGVSLYINGELAGNANGLLSSGVQPINHIYLSQAFAGAISEFYIHNSSLSAADVKNLYNQVIPEPSSATLGLLGIGALMLRRRRSV